MHSKEFEEEYEILQSIYSEIELADEKTANGDTIVSIVLFPSTCDDDETRYVTLCLEFNIPPAYPSQTPTILFKNPRGLSESKLTDLHARLMKKCKEDLLDTPMLFHIIDSVQEFLTANNLPASDCPICLNAFHQADVFYRSKCFHYFHSQCLGKFLQNILKNNNSIEVSTINVPSDSKIMAPQFQCPVCREELDPATIDIDKFLDSPPPFGEEEEENLQAEQQNVTSLSKASAEWREHRENMKSLYEKQEKQGGIIDLNQQLGKLLVISSSSSTPASGNEETESVGSMESTGSPDSGTGTASAISKISPTSSDSSHTSSHSSNRPKPNSSSFKSTNRDGGHYHHHQYRSHNNFRHASRRPEGHSGSHRVSEKHTNTGQQKTAQESTSQCNEAHKSMCKNSEPHQPQPKVSYSVHTRATPRGHHSHNTDSRAGKVKGYEERPTHSPQQPQIHIDKFAGAAAAAPLALTTGTDRKTEQSLGRIRNFNRQFHTRGHQNYSNHHNRGYGGARKHDSARQNYEEDQ